MTSATKTRLEAHLLGRIAELEEATEGIKGRQALAAHNNRLRNARMSLARLRGSHTTSQWEAIVAETAGICVRCGYQHDLSVERPVKAYIVPIALGGTAAVDNLMPLCRRCAAAKQGEGINWLESWRHEREQARGTSDAPADA